jgi:transcription initiation factor IIE alpha subunit
MNHYGIDTCPGPLFAQRAPAQQHSPTSMAAADSMDRSTLNRLQRLIYDYLCDQAEGATDEEIAHACGMNPSTQRPRRIELARRGLVVESGTRTTASGRMACVWRCVR